MERQTNPINVNRVHHARLSSLRPPSTIIRFSIRYPCESLFAERRRRRLKPTRGGSHVIYDPGLRYGSANGGYLCASAPAHIRQDTRRANRLPNYTTIAHGGSYSVNGGRYTTSETHEIIDHNRCRERTRSQVIRPGALVHVAAAPLDVRMP